MTLSYTPKGSMLIIAVGNGKRERTHVIDSSIDIRESQKSHYLHFTYLLQAKHLH